MHELFLTGVVRDDDLEMARAVLQGFCAMNSWQSTHRVLFFRGPPQPKGLPKSEAIPKLPQTQALWRDLHQNLARQSYVLQLRYEVFRDRDFGGDAMQTDAKPATLDHTPGTLRWTDIPDPTGNRPVTQRKKVDIPDQRNLIRVVQDNGHVFKSEAIEESHTYFRDNLEFTILRYHSLPQDQQSSGAPAPRSSLPPWDTLATQDPAGKWLLLVRAHVAEDTSPEKMQKAHDELTAVRDELLGVFEFRILDRRVHDTRIAQQQNNMPAALPQKIQVGGRQ
ncbi:Mediator of RNA polymerase II transcription subunit 18 [Pleurostoma richardsiae]|uniref:Mediator of RNA polymerase II transcription subunit 18 n=1 Tax=Pleurostoma richardsiae TaxID=41990 RepID=A0AA38RGQ3_9PEZI|nr:Mediator of RNA polymerase II transcription subunit 18 [Pleurostoma richardsiae]